LNNESYEGFDRNNATVESVSKKPKKHKRKHKLKEKKSSIFKAIETLQQKVRGVVEDEDHFYVDTTPVKSYISVETLHKPARPRYTLSQYKFPRVYGPRKDKKITRYFIHFKKLKDELLFNNTNEFEGSNLSEFDQERWMAYINFKKDNPVSLDEYQNAKSLLQLIERARNHYPTDDHLLEIYLQTIVKVYPIMDVLEMIEKLAYKGKCNK
jgi:hypothetical protein